MQDMKISELMNFVNLLQGVKASETMWQTGKSYFIRTVTMHLVGKLESINDKELLLSKASWIADSGRFSQALNTGELNEIEPFKSDVIVNRNSIIDATLWTHELPDGVK